MIPRIPQIGKELADPGVHFDAENAKRGTRFVRVSRICERVVFVLWSPPQLR